jgi:5'(3')-deoxyribonucleotidase
MRRLLLLDCDGVVADFAGYLLRSVGSDLGFADITDWDIKRFLTADQWITAQTVLERPGWWEAQPIIACATEGVAALRAAGIDIHWVTSPWHSCREWEATRRDWLHRNFSAAAHDVTFTYRKDLVRGDVFVDDRAEHVAAWRERNEMDGGGALLFDAPYNRQGHTGLTRVDWTTILEVVG